MLWMLASNSIIETVWANLNVINTNKEKKERNEHENVNRHYDSW